MEVEKKDETETDESEQVVNPWEVSAKVGEKIDYEKIIKEFGCKRIDQSLIDRVERLTCRQPHVFLRRVYWSTLCVYSTLYENVAKISPCVTDNKARSIFGLTGEDHIGKRTLFPCSAGSSHICSREWTSSVA
ncbi:PREDICTED: tryptophan--tRNA ligase, cytoplasmic-like [Camelina sativa]|uniref:Tryptophanyl-tRNA synthetase n=1 Tax=Camelina sativa TaxID=90675 RepID=A0ABM1RSH1_CAMSA|nr:PREDICTED: tryptophan--tRNA ligase, cytoplasmic-like [Camelina sativa]